MARKSRKAVPEETSLIQTPSAAVLEWPTAIYARLSVENSKKNDHGESVEGQVEICRDYIEEHPWLVLRDTYVDNGWTGTNTNRPEFQRLLADIMSGRIKALVIKDFSRFSRDYIEAGNLLESVFPALGVRFISVADRYDSFETDGSSSSLLIPIKNLINSFYSKDISRKVSTAVHARQMAAAHIPSMIPYGYRKSTTQEYRFEPDPETAENVTRIFQMRVDGMPLNRIASTLEAEGIPSPGKLRYMRGQTKDPHYATSHWTAAMIKMILKNPTYLGHLVFGRMPTALYLGQPNYHYEPDESKWRVLENMHEPLVTQEVFEQAKTMAAGVKQKTEQAMAKGAALRATAVPLFNGVVYCGNCGARMHFQRSTISGKMYLYYFCWKRLKGDCIQTNGIRQDKLIQIVWQTIRTQLLLCVDYQRALERLNNGETTSKLEDCRSNIQSLTLRLNGCRAKRERLYEDFTDGILSPEEYTMMKRRYDAEYQEVSAKLTEVQTIQIRLKKALSGRNEWLMHLQSFVDSDEFNVEMVSALIERILIYQDGDGGKRVEIQFKYAADRAFLDEACAELGGCSE